MSWGTGPWGVTPWGTASVAPPPTIIAVSPGILSHRGGDVITIVGTNFTDPALVEVLLAGNVVGTCYIFDPEFELETNRITAGTPELEDGVYDLRVTTVGGPSPILVGALEYRRFAEEMKIQRVRIGMASPWVSGPRMLTNNQSGE